MNIEYQVWATEYSVTHHRKPLKEPYLVYIGVEYQFAERFIKEWFNDNPEAVPSKYFEIKKIFV